MDSPPGHPPIEVDHIESPPIDRSTRDDRPPAQTLFTSHDPSCTPHPYHRRYDPRARVMRREWRVIASRARRSRATRRFVCVLTRRLIGVCSRERCVVVARASRSSSSSSRGGRRRRASAPSSTQRLDDEGSSSARIMMALGRSGVSVRVARGDDVDEKGVDANDARDARRTVAIRDSRRRVIHRPRRRHRHHESFDISRKWRPLG